MDKRRALKRGILAVAPVMVVLAAAGTAEAKSVDIVAKGACSATSHWKLKAGPRTRGIQAQFEVDTHVAGEDWTVVLTDNGTTVFTGTGTTVAPSDSFTIRQRIADLAGADMISATATNTVTGETCTGSVTV